MNTIWCWIVNNSDRILALVAIVVATVAMIDVRRLFKELEKRDSNTEKRVRQAVLSEMLTHSSSFAAFSRAAQFIDFDKNQPDKQAAIALLMIFGSSSSCLLMRAAKNSRDCDRPQEVVSKKPRKNTRRRLSLPGWAKLRTVGSSRNPKARYESCFTI